MAFTEGNFGMNVTFIDSGANTANRDYAMDDTVVDYAGAEAAAILMLPAVQATSDAPIAQYRVYKGYFEDALVLPSTVQIENTMSLTYQLVLAGNKKANLNVPAPKITMFVAGTGPQSNIVNTNETTNTVLATFTDMFQTAGKFTLSDGEKASRILNGKRVHRKSSRG